MIVQIASGAEFAAARFDLQRASPLTYGWSLLYRIERNIP